ncbi:MAG: hypothetical protein E7331_08465 [Clostridiales bacterium]|nr:hypothetical protein [Clostridiales bacterium]
MNQNENSIWQEENLRLQNTLAVVREEISKIEYDLGIVDGNDRLIHVLDDGSNDAEVQKFVVASKLRTLHQLRLSKKQPYFARMDFRPDEGTPDMGMLRPGETTSVYVGRWGVFETPGYKVWVADWRSPVANLYYSGQVGRISYDAPDGKIEGELFLKRMFSMEDGRLTDVQDTGLAGQERYLTEALSQMTTNRLREVVTTIQAEQNTVIRYAAFSPLCVQGVAGSGKTTIALHRMAWLLYHLQKTVAPQQMLILAPNPLFLSYISRVLPDLGVDHVRQTTFEGLCRQLLKKNMPRVKTNARLVQRLSMPRQEQEQLDHVLRRKGSLEVAERLEAFLSRLEKSCLPVQDIVFLGKTLMTVQQIKRFFLVDLRHFPLAVRRDEIKKLAEKRLETAVREIREGLMALVEKKLDQLLRSMPDGEERRSKARALLDARDMRLDELKQRKKEFVKNFDGFFGKLELLPVYEAFLRDEAERDPENVPVLEATLPLIEKKCVAAEDLPALLLLAKGLLGVERLNIRHVMIDEAQDVSPLQVKALRTLFGHDAFTLVGDLCQGIYGREGLNSWQDISQGIFEKTPEVCRLSTSYRSTVEIMEAAYRVMEKHPVPGEGAARPVERHGPAPLFLSAKNEKERLKAIAQLVEQWQKDGLASVAIVVKTPKAAKALHKALTPALPALRLMSQGDDAFAGGLQVADSSMVKGLEFDGVIIADADEENYPDEPFYAKLLYVLMTRPLHRLCLTAVGSLTPLVK